MSLWKLYGIERIDGGNALEIQSPTAVFLDFATTDRWSQTDPVVGMSCAWSDVEQPLASTH